jgi:hypothetical protein
MLIGWRQFCKKDNIATVTWFGKSTIILVAANRKIFLCP